MNIRVVIFIHVFGLILFGCINSTATNQTNTSEVSSVKVEENQNKSKWQNESFGNYQNYDFVTLHIDGYMPLFGRSERLPYHATAYVDLKNNGYIIDLDDESGSDIYENGTYYNVLSFPGKCYVSFVTEEPIRNLKRENIVSMSFFLAIEGIIKPHIGGESLSRYLVDNSGTYGLNISGFRDSYFEKYKERYFASQITFVKGNQTHNYVYTRIEPITEIEYKLQLNKEFSRWAFCEGVSGMNPFAK